MTHSELCLAIAKKLSKAWIVLYEYQSYATAEFPDVLAFSGGGTILYEIKTSHSDFLADAKKEARKKWRPKVGLHSSWILQERTQSERATVLKLKAESPELYYIQAPHLGSVRYFVCEPGIIDPKEVPVGWGLIWFKGGRMFTKVKSKWWRPDVHSERSILAHAFRRYASGDSRGIIVSRYANATQEVNV